MPELPEVETVCRALSQSVVGRRIARVELRRADLRIPFPKDFAKQITGAKITAISRRAKYVIFTLDNKTSIIAHLGMSGSFLIPALVEWSGVSKHDHVVFWLDDGRTLIYNDPRRFGLMTLVKTSHIETHTLMANLGHEPFSNGFDADYLKAQLARRDAPIKTVLMDQKLVVGVGNIYASEALFLAGVDPRKPAHKAAYKADRIIAAIRTVLADAIKSGGSSLRDFVSISGDAGYFQHHFKVYGREGEACFSCNTAITIIRQAGRSTFFCRKCQR